MQLKKGRIYQFEVEEMAYGGKGIAKVETEQGLFVVFIPNTIPGQVVEARLTKRSKKHAEARLMKLITPSGLEEERPFQPVSGAPFAAVSLEKQRFWKERDSLQQFSRAGIEHINDVYRGFILSPKDWFYRNKMEYSFSAITWDHREDKTADTFGFGFKRRGMWWCVENLNRPSGLFDEAMETCLHEIRKYCEATGLPAWHAPRREGFFRTLMVRYSFHEDALLMCLQTTSEGLEKFDKQGFSDMLEALYPGRIAGLVHCINDEEGDRFDFQKQKFEILRGRDYIMERLSGMDFRISLSSFFQTNPASAERLYQQVVEDVKEYGEEGIVMDLFCGTGTIGQLLAAGAPDSEVIGVDIVESAIHDAKKNASLNGLDNLEFHASDVGLFLKENPQYVGRIGTIVLDPPRAGIHPKALVKMIELGAKTIVYVSCNPSTQARDLVTLGEAGYDLKAYSLVDQFPHTAHIEGIAVLKKES